MCGSPGPSPDRGVSGRKEGHKTTGRTPRKSRGSADLYCRYLGCRERLTDRRALERHRRTHVPSKAAYLCPNPACHSRTKVRPNFSRGDSLKRHLDSAPSGSPCALAYAAINFDRSSCYSPSLADASQALILQKLVPFDPAIHTPF